MRRRVVVGRGRNTCLHTAARGRWGCALSYEPPPQPSCPGTQIAPTYFFLPSPRGEETLRAPPLEAGLISPAARQLASWALPLLGT